MTTRTTTKQEIRLDDPEGRLIYYYEETIFDIAKLKEIKVRVHFLTTLLHIYTI